MYFSLSFRVLMFMAVSVLGRNLPTFVLVQVGRFIG